MHALLGNGEERNKEVAQWEGGGGGQEEIVRRLNRFDSRPDRFCNEHPRDRLISGCGFSTRYRRIERLLLSTEFFLPRSSFMDPDNLWRLIKNGEQFANEKRDLIFRVKELL